MAEFVQQREQNGERREDGGPSGDEVPEVMFAQGFDSFAGEVVSLIFETTRDVGEFFDVQRLSVERVTGRHERSGDGEAPPLRKMPANLRVQGVEPRPAGANAADDFSGEACLQPPFLHAPPMKAKREGECREDEDEFHGGEYLSGPAPAGHFIL